MSLSVNELADSQSESPDSGDTETVQLYLTAIEYTDDSGTPTTHLFGRDSSQTKYHVRVSGHRPRFYVRASDYNERVENHYAVYDTKHVSDTTLDDEPLVAIYTYLPKQVSDLRDMFEQTYEADVFYANRWLIDNDIYTGVEVEYEPSEVVSSGADPKGKGRENTTLDLSVEVGDVSPCDPPTAKMECDEDTNGVDESDTVNPRVGTIDIEVASESGVPDTDEANWPVSTIVAHDSYTDEYVGWLLSHEDHPAGPWQLSEIGVDEYRRFTDEKQLLDDFNRYVSDKSFDIFTGWFSNDFDYPYLVNRCRRLSVYSYQDWSEMGDVWITNRRKEPVVGGATPFDMLDGYEKTQIHELDSKKLEDVAQNELGYGKRDVEQSHTEMWQQSPAEFLHYNKVDVQLVVEIEAEQDIFNTFDHIRSIAGCQIDAPLGGNIDLMDVYFLREANERGYRLPTAEKPDKGWYYGAKVFDMAGGINENVVYLDLSSLYPNLIRQLNVSPETMYGVEKPADTNTAHGYIDTRPDSVKEESDPDMGPCYYDYDTEGFVSSLVNNVIEMKNEYRGTEKYGAIKRITNCFTPDTEVMTPNGAVSITDLSVGDSVYSIDPDTLTVEVKPVEKVWSYPEYDGNIVSIQNSVTDLKVTPNHRLLTHKWRNDDTFKWREAGNLNEWSEYRFPHGWNVNHGSELEQVNIADLPGVDEYEVKIDTDVHGRTIQGAVDWDLGKGNSNYYIIDSDTYEEHRDTLHDLCDDSDFSIHMNRGESWTPMIWDGDDVIQFCAWYITEGSQYTTTPRSYDNGNVRGESTKISIAQEDTGHGHVDEISTLLDSIGLTYNHNDGRYEITGSNVIATMVEEMCGKGYENKHIPDMFFNVSERQKQLLFDTLMDGDGDENSNRYTTASKQLRDDMMKLSIHLGLQPKYSWEGGEHRYGSGVWRIRPIQSKNSFTMHDSGSVESAESGVYSVTVADNHTVLAGRNGKFQWVGQSIYGVLSDSDSYGTGFRLFDWRMGESITLSGRAVIDFCAGTALEYAQEHGYGGSEVVLGDTDGFGIPLDGCESDEAVVTAAQEIASHINSELPQFCAEEFGISEDDSTMEIEVESYFERVFTGTAKKRYATVERWNDDDGWLDEPELSVKGYEYVRSDVATVTKEAQEYVFNAIMRHDLGVAHELVSNYIQWLVDAIKSGTYPLAKIGRPFGIGQALDEYGSASRTPQPSYRGARYANDVIYDGSVITEGDKPLLYYVTGVGDGYRSTYPSAWDNPAANRRVDAVSVQQASDLPDAVAVDTETMIDKTLRDPLGRIFSVLGWDMDEMLLDSEQRDLSSYF